MKPFPYSSLLVPLGTLLVLAGCGGDGDTEQSTESDVSTSSTTPVEPAATNTPTGTGNGGPGAAGQGPVAPGVGGAQGVNPPPFGTMPSPAGMGGSTPMGGSGGESAMTPGGPVSTGGMTASGGESSAGGPGVAGQAGEQAMGGGGASQDPMNTAGSPAGGSPNGGNGGVPSGGSGGQDEGAAGASSDSDGCSLLLEGFATLNADGQNGTYGGRDGETVTVTTHEELNDYATRAEPYTIRVQGAITVSPKGTEIRVASDKTIIGVGTSGEIVEGGFFLAEGVHNVIIRNLTIRDTFVEGDWDGKDNDFDGVQMDTAHHVWIDHCHFHHLGDGIIDSRKDTTYLTVSWNILSDHNKAFGIGWTDNVIAQMTIHHNWFRDLNQRNPSTDNVLRAHLYNNWMQRLDSYGNWARGGTNMVLENSVFDTVKDPYYYDTGSLVAIGNLLSNTTGQQEASGSSYSFFDPSDFYSYDLDPASEVQQKLTQCAGPRPELGL